MTNPLFHEDLVRERIRRYEVEIAELERFRRVKSPRQTWVNLLDFISGLICRIGFKKLRVSDFKGGAKINHPC